MTCVAVLQIRSRDCPFMRVTEMFPNVEARTFYHAKFQNENTCLCKITGSDEERQEFFHAFKAHPLTRELDVISETDDTLVLSAKIDYSKSHKGVRSIIDDLGCHHADWVTCKGGYEEWVLCSKEPLIGTVIKTLEANGCKVKLRKTCPVDSWEDSLLHLSMKDVLNSLTPKQRYIFKVAHAMGYYDDKRKVSLEQIAKELGVSKPAVWRHIHNFEEKIMKTVSELV